MKDSELLMEKMSLVDNGFYVLISISGHVLKSMNALSKHPFSYTDSVAVLISV